MLVQLTVLQYVCPVGILVYTCIKDKGASNAFRNHLYVFSYRCGTFLIATWRAIDQSSMTPAGLFWGLFSALTYALYIILPIKLIQKWGSILVIGVGMTISGIPAVISYRAYRG